MNEKHKKTYLILNEVFNAVTHGIAAGLAIFGLVLLILKGINSGSQLQLVSFTVYGVMLVALFLFSTLAHSLHFTRARKVFQVLDHSGIYLLIAGSYVPYCLVTLNDWLGWIVLAVVWLCALIGIVISAVFLPRAKSVPRFSTVLYVAMGWMVLLAIYPLYQKLPHVAFWLLLAGGVTYTLGAVIYRFKFPFAHVVWHLFVFAAAFFIWLSIYGYVS
ncbi:MAG: hemolysin III family protein [Streptococcaceae bacterium]|jgi:hemolysin III|nr:hemolysin III family protein [Streptococcaceae bacterium]